MNISFFSTFSLVYIISAVASPVFGFCIDKTGKNIFWVILGTVVTLGCHAVLAFTFITPFLAMVSVREMSRVKRKPVFGVSD